jgi:hypothetical protein
MGRGGCAMTGEDELPTGRPARRRGRGGVLIVAFVVLVVAAVLAAVQGGWWVIGAVAFAGGALLVAIAGIAQLRDPRAVETVMARQSRAGGVNRAAEQAVRKTGGGGAGGMGSGVAETPALYRETQPWDEHRLPPPINASAQANRASRRAGARATQRRETKLTQLEQVDRAEALRKARARHNGPTPKGR